MIIFFNFFLHYSLNRFRKSLMAASAGFAGSENGNEMQGMKCAISRFPLADFSSRVEVIIDNLKSIKQLSIPHELSINVISIIVGSFVGYANLHNSDNKYQRNHECPTFVNNLLQTPASQLSPSVLEHIEHNNVETININQYLYLIDPMYSREEHEIPYGLASVYSSVLKNPIISTSGIIKHDQLLSKNIKYNSFLEPYIIPDNIDELQIESIIEKIQNARDRDRDNYLLINIMDCTSNVLRKLWIQNTEPNVYLAMPDCLAIDNLPMYKPVITFSDSHEWTGCRWINWNRDKDMMTLYKAFSPHTYEFLIHNYKRMVLETYFIPICKILGRMRISLEYKINADRSIIFSQMTFPEFKYLWTQERALFVPLFISFMDSYYKWNYYKFIDILINENIFNEELSMQRILLSYLETHLAQLKIFFPDEPIPAFINDEQHLQSDIYNYMHYNGIH